MEKTTALTTRTITRSAIIAFCLWHMFAVLSYSIPRVANDRVAVTMRRIFLPVVTPYMQTFSQWQLWDLFSPDPLRRVTVARIEIDRGSGWIIGEYLYPDSFAWWRHAARFKYIINALDPFEKGKDPAKIRFVQYQCHSLQLPAGTPIRIVYQYYIIPLFPSRPSNAQWKKWGPDWQQIIGVETTCPVPLP